jgi:hypothetical protein
MIKVFLLTISLTFLFACKDESLPEGILAPKKIEPILWDLIRADQALPSQYIVDTTGDRAVKSKEMYRQVLLLHRVSEADFKKSFRYYQSHPTALKPVLDSLRNKPSEQLLPL